MPCVLYRASWTASPQPSRWDKSTQQDRLRDTQGKNSSAEKPLRVWEAEADNTSALCPRGRHGQPHPACSSNTVTRSPRQVTYPLLLAAVRPTLKPSCVQVWAPQFYTLTLPEQVCGEPTLGHRKTIGFAQPEEEPTAVFNKVTGRGAEKTKPGCPHRGHTDGWEAPGVTAPQGIPLRYQDIPPLPQQWPEQRASKLAHSSSAPSSSLDIFKAQSRQELKILPTVFIQWFRRADI